MAGIDLGLKDFAIVNDGVKTSKYPNPKHLAKHERNLKRKQRKLDRKEKGSKSREKQRINHRQLSRFLNISKRHRPRHYRVIMSCNRFSSFL